MQPQQYCLRWKYHHSNLQTMFSQLLDRGCFCDVTLACEGQTIKAHRVVLCACSTYFDSILTNCSSEKDPIIIMKDAKFSDMKCLIEFMYKGEINVEHASLASLLKTAEELKIKGLAEVSWRDEEQHGSNIENSIEDTLLQAQHHQLQQLKQQHQNLQHQQQQQQQHQQQQHRVMSPPSIASSSGGNVSGDQKHVPHLAPINTTHHNKDGCQTLPLPLRKKRGRPPLDAEFHESQASRQKLAQIEAVAAAVAAAPYSADNTHLVSILMDENSKDKLTKTNNNMSWPEQNMDTHMDYEDEEPSANIIPKLERPETPLDGIPHPDDISSPNSPSDMGASSSQPLILSQQELEEWKDVIKMNDYLTKGRRPQFWEEPFCKRVMDAIKNKDLEMKKAAQILGVSYGTLYGRYRETYGCLKHPYRGPFMVSRLRDMWSDQTPTEIINLLQKGVITLPRAAELMNTSPATVSGILDQSQEWLHMAEHEGDRDILDVDENCNDDDDRNDINNKENTHTADKNKDKEKDRARHYPKTDKISLSLPNHPEVSLINVNHKKSPPPNIPTNSSVDQQQQQQHQQQSHNFDKST